MKNYAAITLLLLIPLLGLMAQPTDEEQGLLDRARKIQKRNGQQSPDRAPGDTAAKADRNQPSPQTDNSPQNSNGPKIGFGLVNVVNIYAQYDWHFLNNVSPHYGWGYRAAGRSDPLT